MQSYRTILVFLLLAVGVLGFGGSLSAQNLKVRMEGVRASEGTIRLGFYDSKAQWDSEKSSFQRAASKANLKDGVIEFFITDVEPGEYCVAIADDENDNGEMDWGWILPKEGFGFSNYVLKGIRRPQYEDFKFDLLPEGETTIVIKVRYL
ncbi:MAG: DUF2141 domain-containing protein [Saprospiraceae bacterium]